VVVQEDVDLAVALEAGDRIDGDPAAARRAALARPFRPGSTRCLSWRCSCVPSSFDHGMPSSSLRRSKALGQAVAVEGAHRDRESGQSASSISFSSLAADVGAQRRQHLRALVPHARGRAKAARCKACPRKCTPLRTRRVAGPMHTTPCARKQSSGIQRVWCGRLNSVKRRSAGLAGLRVALVAQGNVRGKHAAFGRQLPASSAPTAALVIAGVGGQPGM
jgi:hypothetical protein